MSNQRLAQRRGAQRGRKNQQNTLVIWARRLGDVAPHEAWQAGTLVSKRGQSVAKVRQDLQDPKLHIYHLTWVTLEDANYENGPQYSCKGRAKNIFSGVRFGLKRELS